MKEQEIEFLPPKQLLECPDCHKHFTHLERCRDKDDKGRLIKRCWKCKKNQVTNIFYIPFKNRRDFIGKYSLSKQERGRIYSQKISQGMSPEQAWRSVGYLQRCMKRSYWSKKGLDKIKQMKEEKGRQEAEEQRKRFLEGLNSK